MFETSEWTSAGCIISGNCSNLIVWLHTKMHGIGVMNLRPAFRRGFHDLLGYKTARGVTRVDKLVNVLYTCELLFRNFFRRLLLFVAFVKFRSCIPYTSSTKKMTIIIMKP